MTNTTVNIEHNEATLLLWVLFLFGTYFTTEAVPDTTPTTMGNITTAAATYMAFPYNPVNLVSMSVLHLKHSLPLTGTFSLSDNKGKVCLKVVMGVQYTITKNKKISYFNLDPPSTEATGVCGENISFLTLKFKTGNLGLTFNKDGNVSYVTTVNGSLEISACKSCKSQLFTGVISNRTLFQAANGFSYKCNSPRILLLAENFRIKIVNVQVQAFDIIDGQFGMVEECWPDYHKRILPIILGATAVGMGLIVILTFLVVRDNRPQGYERI
ncbi:lysosome-associated membrane glycoprotein 3 [Megalops cyprinoides]|uniref:lysosome-associated membrane glycoprotein 3 n=1 Tax=Megalops cyprinoides TaxID=118141 RepID=UPI001864BD9C|nr:lysosome-associated membrane glycoprotein 3 [Megalops cyprinoides]